VIIKADKSDL